MQILILGAGVIGVTTAYELIKTGHNITIIDRNPEPALETSYGNAGSLLRDIPMRGQHPNCQKIYLSPYMKNNVLFALNSNGI